MLLNNKKWHDPIEITPQLGSTEICSFMNTTAFSHRMHIHLIQFQILERWPFDLDRYNEDGQIIFTQTTTNRFRRWEKNTNSIINNNLISIYSNNNLASKKAHISKSEPFS
ncbi:MAG: multicopper oxidase domain-containing protein [Bacillota bacterium]